MLIEYVLFLIWKLDLLLCFVIYSTFLSYVNGFVVSSRSFTNEVFDKQEMQ